MWLEDSRKWLDCICGVDRSAGWRGEQRLLELTGPSSVHSTVPVRLVPELMVCTLYKKREGNSESRVQQEGNWRKTATAKRPLAGQTQR